MRRRLAGVLLALPLVVALALAGCGDSDGDDDGIATAGDEAAEDGDGGDGGSSPDELSEEEMYEAQLAYTECMREHGIDMEDPQPGEPLRVQLRGDPEEARAAQEACQDLLPAGGPGGGANDPRAQERMLEFAQCMRDNGVESFPDPQPGGGIQIGPDQAEDPDFEAAQETCREGILGDGPTQTNEGGGNE
jgi:hypothetical protein